MFYLSSTNASVIFVEQEAKNVKPIALVSLSFQDFDIDADNSSGELKKIEFAADEDNVEVLANFFSSLLEEVIKRRNPTLLLPED